MIQRIQSLLFLLSGIASMVIIYYAPILDDGGNLITLKDDNYEYARISLLCSVAISIYTITQFKKRKRQILLAGLSRLFILVCFVLLLWDLDPNIKVSYGSFLLFIPWISLFFAGYFIKKDDKLVKSSDRIR